MTAHVPPLTAQRCRFVVLMRRHVNGGDALMTDDDLVRAVYRRWKLVGEIKGWEPPPGNELLGQRKRYTEIMRRHVRAQDSNLGDYAFVEAVYARYAQERGCPLIDPAE